MPKGPLTSWRSRTALLACLGLILLGGCSPQEVASTTVDDLQEQISRQFKRQWPTDAFQSVQIDDFERPAAENQMAIGLMIRWDAQNSTGTSMTLHQAAGRYYVGTFRLDGGSLPAPLQERARSLRPVKVMLSFKP